MSTDVKTAIIEQLRALNVQPGKAISIYQIGVPLVSAGYHQDQIVNALFSLERDRVIELLQSNGLRLIEPLAH